MPERSEMKLLSVQWSRRCMFFSRGSAFRCEYSNKQFKRRLRPWAIYKWEKFINVFVGTFAFRKKDFSSFFFVVFKLEQPWMLVTFEPSANLCAWNFSFIFILIWLRAETGNWWRNEIERISEETRKAHLQLKNYFREQIKLQIVAFRNLQHGE